MNKTFLFAPLFVLFFTVLPTHADAFYNEEQNCHWTYLKRYNFCQAYQWDASEWKKIKTKNIDEGGSRILQVHNHFPNPELPTEDGTVLLKVNVWKSNGLRVRKWMKQTQPRGKARLQKLTYKPEGNRYFTGKEYLVRNRKFVDSNGKTQRQKTLYVRQGKRMYKFTLSHWGEHTGSEWEQGKSMLASFELQ